MEQEGFKSKRAQVILLLCLLQLLLTACAHPVSESEKEQPLAGLANPASTYCVDQGYENVIRTNPDGSQTGYCIFPDGTECEEWQFYRAECKNG